MTPNSTALDVVKLLIRLQRLNRFVARAYGTKASLSETHFLSELNRQPGRSAAYYARVLGLNRSSASRLVKRLEVEGLVKDCYQPGSGNVLLLHLTTKGIQRVKISNLLANKQIDNLTKSFSKLQIETLTLLLRRLAGGLNAPPAALGPDDHPLRLEIRRLTRKLGILSNRFFQTEHSSSDIQILVLIAEFPSTCARDLVKHLGVNKSTLSRELAPLVASAWVDTTPSKKDARHVSLSISEAGQGILKVFFTLATRQISKGLNCLSPDEKQNLVKLLAKLGT